jgi:hypothetical protein
MNVGIAMTALLLVACMMAWRMLSTARTEQSAMVVAMLLGLVAGAVNVVVPLPAIEVATLVVVCTAMALGAGPAATAAFVVVLAGALSGGIGLWTPWQLAGMLLVVACGVLFRRGSRSNLTVALSIVVATCCYDVVLTVSSVYIFLPSGGDHGEALRNAALLGAPWFVMHLIGNVVGALVLAPSLMQALHRVAVRSGIREPDARRAVVSAL